MGVPRASSLTAALVPVNKIPSIQIEDLQAVKGLCLSIPGKAPAQTEQLLSPPFLPPGCGSKAPCVCLPQTFRGCTSFQRIWLPPSPEAKALDAPSLSTGNREGPKLRLSFSSLPIQFLIPTRKGRHPQWAGLPNLEQPNQDNTCAGSNLDSTNPRRSRPVFWGIPDFVKVALTHTHPDLCETHWKHPKHRKTQSL